MFGILLGALLYAQMAAEPKQYVVIGKQGSPVVGGSYKRHKPKGRSWKIMMCKRNWVGKMRKRSIGPQKCARKT
jgi:hypothetical protein